MSITASASSQEETISKEALPLTCGSPEVSESATLSQRSTKEPLPLGMTSHPRASHYFHFAATGQSHEAKNADTLCTAA